MRSCIAIATSHHLTCVPCITSEASKTNNESRDGGGESICNDITKLPFVGCHENLQFRCPVTCQHGSLLPAVAKNQVPLPLFNTSKIFHSRGSLDFFGCYSFLRHCDEFFFYSSQNTFPLSLASKVVLEHL